MIELILAVIVAYAASLCAGFVIIPLLKKAKEMAKEAYR